MADILNEDVVCINPERVPCLNALAGWSKRVRY